MNELNGIYTFSTDEAEYVADILRAVRELQAVDGEKNGILSDMIQALENADQILVEDESLREVD